MANATLIGIDLGKHCFFVHAQDARGAQVWRKKMTRKQLYAYLATCPVAVLAMEACAGAHWLARKCQLYGHRVRLIAPQFVRPFVKGNKTDFADAEAICEAASRPSMRLVTVKTAEQQTLLALHRVRESLVGERTQPAIRFTLSCSNSVSTCQLVRWPLRACRCFLMIPDTHCRPRWWPCCCVCISATRS